MSNRFLSDTSFLQAIRISKPCIHLIKGFPRWLSGKESTCNAGDPGLITGSGRSPAEGNGYPFQYSCLENPMDKEPDGLPTSWGDKEADTTEQLTMASFRELSAHMLCEQKHKTEVVL